MIRGHPGGRGVARTRRHRRGRPRRRLPHLGAHPPPHARAVAAEVPRPPPVQPVGGRPRAPASRGARAGPHAAPRPPARAARSRARPRAHADRRGPRPRRRARHPSPSAERPTPAIVLDPSSPAPLEGSPTMRPRFEILDRELIERIVDEALALLRSPGIKVEEPEAIRVLVAGGATADGERVSIPEAMVRRALDTVARLLRPVRPRRLAGRPLRAGRRPLRPRVVRRRGPRPGDARHAPVARSGPRAPHARRGRAARVRRGLHGDRRPRRPDRDRRPLPAVPRAAATRRSRWSRGRSRRAGPR